MFERILPSRHAHAPFVARLESGKIPFRVRCHEIVAIEHREIEELARHLRADSVQSHITRAGPAKSVTIESSKRIPTTGLKFGFKNVGWHLLEYNGKSEQETE
jgi:hypothetical protein